MSDLQLALIVLGVLAVAAVAIYNVWQERQFRRRSEKALPATGGDPLLEADARPEFAVRREPGFGGERLEPALLEDAWSPDPASAVAADPTPPSTVATEAPSARGEPPPREATRGPAPAPARAGGSPGGPAAAATRARPVSPLDPAGALAGPAGLWYPVVFRLPASVDTTTLAGIRAVVAGEGRMAEWLDGEPAAGGAGQDDGQPADGQPITVDRVLRVQAVDVQGPAAAGELARLLLTAEQAAARVGGEAVAPDPDTTAAAAAALHEFCTSVDVTIGLNIAASGAGFSGTKLRGVIEAAGFVMAPDHSYLLSDESGNTLCTLTDGSGAGLDPQALKAQAVRAISLLLDVPRTPGALAQFERMAGMARQFAQVLSGRVVDDSGKVLDDASIGRIRTQLASIVQAMRARGIEPGDAVARRVFG